MTIRNFPANERSILTALINANITQMSKEPNLVILLASECGRKHVGVAKLLVKVHDSPTCLNDSSGDKIGSNP